MRRVQAEILQRLPGVTVELAFLEFMAPTLLDCVNGLIEQGVRKIVVLPMFIAQGGHLKRDVPELLDQLRGQHPGVEFLLSGPIGENEIVVQAMASAALEFAGL